MVGFKKWLEMTSSGTSTASVATVPMRMLADNGRPYIGIPGRPSPFDKKNKPTIVGRKFPNDDDKNSKHVENLPYKWMRDMYSSETQILYTPKK